MVAHQVAENAELYYQAMKIAALREKKIRDSASQNTKYSTPEFLNAGLEGNEQWRKYFPAIPADRCAYAISPLPLAGEITTGR